MIRLRGIVAILGMALGLTVVTAAAAQAEATLTLTPASGRCNGSVTAAGSGFPANASVQLALGQPDGDTEVAELAVVAADVAGSFETEFAFPSEACDLGGSRLTVFADQADEPDDESIYTRTTYQVVGAALPASGSGTARTERWLLPLAVLSMVGLSAIAAGLTIGRPSAS